MIWRATFACILLALSACAAGQPPQPPPEPPAPPVPVGWEPIRSANPNANVVRGYVQRRGLVASGAVRRAWILLDLREPILVAQTGSQARSVRFMGEYRCGDRQWRPLEGAWFAQQGGQEPVHAERPRRGAFHAAAESTLDGAFLDAACSL